MNCSPGDDDTDAVADADDGWQCLARQVRSGVVDMQTGDWWTGKLLELLVAFCWFYETPVTDYLQEAPAWCITAATLLGACRWLPTVCSRRRRFAVCSWTVPQILMFVCSKFAVAKIVSAADACLFFLFFPFSLSTSLSTLLQIKFVQKQWNRECKKSCDVAEYK